MLCPPVEDSILLLTKGEGKMGNWMRLDLDGHLISADIELIPPVR